MAKSKKPLLIIPSNKIIFIFYGICIITLFFIVYLIIAFKTGKIDYFSMFFNNISNHIIFTILTFIHVGFLGVGILTIIFAFFNLSPKINAYEDRFEIRLFLQNKKIVEFKKLKNVDIKVFYTSNENAFLNKFKKECRVFFNNPVYNFYLAYPVNGYFDNIEINIKNKDSLLRRCITSRKNIDLILNHLNKDYSIVKQYLPEECINTKIHK
jgi:hypothetical protein